MCGHREPQERGTLYREILDCALLVHTFSLEVSLTGDSGAEGLLLPVLRYADESSVTTRPQIGTLFHPQLSRDIGNPTQATEV